MSQPIRTVALPRYRNETSVIAPGSITSTEIANNTITAANIAPGTITTTEIANGTITTADLAAGADGSVLYYDTGTTAWRTDVLKCSAVTPSVGLFDITLNGAARQTEAHTTLFAEDTNAGTRSLTSTAARYIRYNNATQVNLPDCATLSLGFTIEIFMNSASSLPVHISTGSGLVATVLGNFSAKFTCISLTNATTSWLVAASSPSYAGGEIMTVSLSAGSITSASPNEIIAWDVASANTPSITNNGTGSFTINFPGVYQTTLSVTCNTGSIGRCYINYSSGTVSQYATFDPSVWSQATVTHTIQLTGGTVITARFLEATRNILGGTPGYSYMQIVRLS